MPGLFDNDPTRRLYASRAAPNTWMALGGLAFGVIVFLAVVPMSVGWIWIIAIAGLAIAIFAFGTGRRKVTELSRRGDQLHVTLTGGRTFTAPVNQFSAWRYVELGRASAINFHWQGQRYVLATQTASLIDPEGFAELDPLLGKALAGRWNASTLRGGRP